MILYQGTSKEFCELADSNQLLPTLEKVFKEKLGRRLPPNEIEAYTNSLPKMGPVLRRSKISDDCGVLIEYVIPLTSNRVDFIVSGEDDAGNMNFIIVELKQWQTAEPTDSDGVVRTALAGGIRETTHPSYQAHSYRLFMSDFNSDIEIGKLRAQACAYLHNFISRDPEPLLQKPYDIVTKEAPIFFRDDQKKLEHFLYRYVNKGKGTKILYHIESGKIKPTKKLINHVSGLLKGNQEFTLLDEQKIAFEKARLIARYARKKSVVIINGGPGTGKSVISVNLLGQLLKDEINVVFVAPNASFRGVLIKKIAQEHSEIRIKNLFKGSSAFVDIEPNTFDALVVDEAHRLKNNTAFMYRGENQVEDVIKASKTTILFVDDDQAIRPEDIGTVIEIKRVAKKYDADIHEVKLEAQFRCAGAEGYINWLNNTLHIKETANYDGWEDENFDFKILDDPNELRKAIKAKHDNGYLARILAGYAWKWTSANEGNSDAQVDDVEIPEFDFMMPWNSRKVGSTWAIDASGIDQVGCIHTSQGLEFDYVGIIVGKDLRFDPQKMSYFSEYDEYKDNVGKSGLKKNPDILNRFIRNIYKILMSRGMQGCYVYFQDSEVKKYFISRNKTLSK